MQLAAFGPGDLRLNKIMVAASLGALASLLMSIPASAETTQCTEITSVPFTIVASGVYCLKKVISTAMTSGNAITINANNVVIDFNDFRLGGLSAGPETNAIGVYASDRQNITIRNGSIRGFAAGIRLDQATAGLSTGHVIEDNLLDGNTTLGISVNGSDIVVRRNRVVNTDSTPPAGLALHYTAPATSGAITVGPATSLPKLSNQPISQIGTGGTVNAILATLQDSEIVDNFVATTVSSGGQALAIVLAASSNVVVSRNTISDVRGSSITVGIGLSRSVGLSAQTISDNIIMGGSSTGSTAFGIASYGGSILCLDNVVADFASGQTLQCASELGTFPPLAP